MKAIADYDVIVVGGGVSGVCAAISAGRSGARTLIIEQAGYLGGTLTSCGVGPMMAFFAGEKQVVFGLMQEIVDLMVQQGGSCGHIRDTTRYVSFITPFDAECLKVTLDHLTAQAGCDVLFHTFAGGVAVDGGEIKSVTVCNKDGIRELTAKVFIDATGDGDIMAWAGAETVKGRPSDGASQPLTMKMRYCNVDTPALKSYVRSHLEDFPRLKDNLDLLDSASPLALAGFDSAFRRARENGEHTIEREDVLMFETNRSGEFIINTTRILNTDVTDAAALSRAEIEGRRQCAQLDRFLRKYAPGFESAMLMYTGPSVGIRGSRQLVGVYTLTGADIVSARRFPSVIAHSGYPIDIHSPDGVGTVTHHIGADGGRAYYDIPFEIMLPKDIGNLLVAGRCVSADFEAQASIRLTPSAGAMGQAAGIAAAFAAREGIALQKTDIRRLQRALKNGGAYIESEE